MRKGSHGCCDSDWFGFDQCSRCGFCARGRRSHLWMYTSRSSSYSWSQIDCAMHQSWKCFGVCVPGRWRALFDQQPTSICFQGLGFQEILWEYHSHRSSAQRPNVASNVRSLLSSPMKGARSLNSGISVIMAVKSRFIHCTVNVLMPEIKEPVQVAKCKSLSYGSPTWLSFDLIQIDFIWSAFDLFWMCSSTSHHICHITSHHISPHASTSHHIRSHHSTSHHMRLHQVMW